MTPILMVIASAALARAGLTPGQAQLALTGLTALLGELGKLKPEEVGAWLASLPKAPWGDPECGGNERAPGEQTVAQSGTTPATPPTTDPGALAG